MRHALKFLAVTAIVALCAAPAFAAYESPDNRLYPCAEQDPAFGSVVEGSGTMSCPPPPEFDGQYHAAAWASATQEPEVTWAQFEAAPAPAPAAPSPLLAAFWQFVFPLLLSGLGALASWALVKLATYLSTLGVTNKWALLGAQLTTLVQHVVADAEVSLRPLFAKSMEDGKLTPEEGAALKAAVIDLLKKEAPDLMRQLGAATGGLLDKVLGGAVENAVAKLPASDGAVLKAAPAAGPQAP